MPILTRPCITGKLLVTYREEQSTSDIPSSCSTALPTISSSFTKFASKDSNNFSHEQQVVEIKYKRNSRVTDSSIVEYLYERKDFFPDRLISL